MTGPANPQAFSPRGTLAIVIAGIVSFVVLLGWLGTGQRPENDGGAHAMGKGIAGYAALAAMLGAEGHSVRFNRTPDSAGTPALMVLTPPHYATPKTLARIIAQRRAGLGPTLLITPKWQTMRLASDPRVSPDSLRSRVFGPPGAPAGWTTIIGAAAPAWQGLLDHVGVRLGDAKGAPAHGWTMVGASGPLPDDRQVLSGGGSDDEGHPLVPLVRAGDGRILAGYFADGGSYPDLARLAGVAATGDDTALKPLVVVFEPDLFDNRGLANRETALAAGRIITALAAGSDAGAAPAPVVFDLAQNGLGAPRNLLTLAFTPPFLAATICLIVAVAGSVWRGFVRFGSPRDGAPAARVARVALVSGTARLLLRARRHHLLAGPYADAVRERLRIALALPRGSGDGAIARIQAVRAPRLRPFAEAAARLEAARGPAAIAAAAAELHAIEQALTHAPQATGTPQ